MRASTLLAVGLLAVSAAAQDPCRDLGDPARGEAAELALVQLGPAAAKPLEALLSDFDPHAERAEARLEAALRVIDLLGPAVAELQPALDALAVADGTPALARLIWARGSLAPYSGSDEWSGAFHKTISGRKDRAEMFTGFQRHATRLQVSAGEATDRLLQRLADDEIFAREVAAELLGKGGDAAAVEPLRRRLEDRDRQPKGFDGLRHNGVVVPMQDGFRLRAAEALLQLCPGEPPAVALGCRALLHPHRSVRLAALAALGALGPMAQPAVPELLQLARADDAQLAAEALKVLGMSASRDPQCLAVAEALQHSADAAVQQRAKSLAARLRAMKVALPPPPPPAAAGDPELAAAVAKLDGEGEAAAMAQLRQAGAAALPAVRERLLRDGASTPDAVVRLCGELGRGLDEPARDELRWQLMQRHGDNWNAPMMSSSSGGGSPDELDREVYAELVVGAPTPAELGNLLEHDNAAVRLAAAKRLQQCGDAVRDGAALQGQLLAAARSEHPAKSKFELQRHHHQELATPFDARIQAAAAAALLPAAVDAAEQPRLLDKLLAHADAATVAVGVQRWGGAAELLTLQRLLDDPRGEVAAAAATAIGARGHAAADAVVDLERAAARDDAKVAAAAKAALQRVQGGG